MTNKIKIIFIIIFSSLFIYGCWNTESPKNIPTPLTDNNESSIWIENNFESDYNEEDKEIKFENWTKDDVSFSWSEEWTDNDSWDLNNTNKNTTKNDSEDSMNINDIDEESNNWDNSFKNLDEANKKWISLICEFKDDKNFVTNMYIRDSKIFLEWKLDDPNAYDWIIENENIFFFNKEVWYNVDLGKNEWVIKMWKTNIKSFEDMLDLINEQKDNCRAKEFEKWKFDIPKDIEIKKFWSN